MKRDDEFLTFVVEQMRFGKRLRTQAMFGGYGLYLDDRIFAIVAAGRLYFKAGAATRALYEDRGLSRFSYRARGKSVSLSYYEAPPEVFDEPEALHEWAQQAYRGVTG